MPAMRQAGGSKRTEGGLAEMPDPFGAGQLLFHGAERIGERDFRVGAGGDDASRHGHSAAALVT